ncbi:MAG TPA: PCRF domain-containing protein, partial [Chthoniobacteraceae bacterium]|nr:PCRF domain-containing protein [Chthoniobacteraceae bacterium]
MDFAPLIEKKAGRFQELEANLSSGNLFDNPAKAREVMREHARLKDLLAAWEAFGKAKTQLAENQELAKGNDAEMAEMAEMEIPELEKKIAALDHQIQIALLPPDPNEDRDAIMEIRAGTGGSEAALFAADLFRMYNKFAETRGLKIEEMESSPSELGGLKEVIFRVSGGAVFRQMRYESGVHRVQRVPATEAQGRIHTSTATVA